MNLRLQHIALAAIAAIALSLCYMGCECIVRNVAEVIVTTVNDDGGELHGANLWVRETGEAVPGGGTGTTLTIAQRTVRTASENKPSQDDNSLPSSGHLATLGKKCSGCTTGTAMRHRRAATAVHYYIVVRHIIR